MLPSTITDIEKVLGTALNPYLSLAVIVNVNTLSIDVVSPSKVKLSSKNVNPPEFPEENCLTVPIISPLIDKQVQAAIHPTLKSISF